jgi:membrane protein
VSAALQRVAAKVRALVAWARTTALRLLDVVPGLRRLVSDLVRIELIDRSMIIAAQGMFALVPLLIVMSAFLPHDLAVSLTQRFEVVTGVGRPQAAVVRQTLTPDQIRSATGVFGLLLTLLSATSFSRALQRMHERVWEVTHVSGPAGLARSILWLVGWLLGLQLVALLGALFLSDRVGPLKLVAQIAASSLIWWWSARLLLAGRVSWRMLAPGAVLTGFTTILYTVGGRLVMPHYAATSARQLGALGVVLAVATWMVGFGAVLVVAAVVGRVIAEEEPVRTEARRIMSLWRTAFSRRLGRGRAGRAGSATAGSADMKEAGAGERDGPPGGGSGTEHGERPRRASDLG